MQTTAHKHKATDKIGPHEKAPSASDVKQLPLNDESNKTNTRNFLAGAKAVCTTAGPHVAEGMPKQQSRPTPPTIARNNSGQVLSNRSITTKLKA
jgi:hypothetical protein